MTTSRNHPGMATLVPSHLYRQDQQLVASEQSIFTSH
jgi:hypothetical protein